MCSISEISKTSKSEPVLSKFAGRFTLAVYSVVGLEDLVISLPEPSLAFSAVI